VQHLLWLFVIFLQVHGEVTDPHVDTFDREKVFIDKILAPLVQKLPQLKIVMEHITTMDAVNFIESCEEGAALLLEWHHTSSLSFLWEWHYTSSFVMSITLSRSQVMLLQQ